MTLGSFGKYELLKKVGAGGMGELFLARQSGIEGFQKLIVIKRILPQLVAGDSDHFIKMFLDEARLAARLTHPNIVQIYDLGRVDELYYLAMEYVNGVDLRRLLRQAGQQDLPLPQEHAVKIISNLCEALAYAHDLRDDDGTPLNIVHRDVSPHNVLVGFDGTVKLTDFGIAKASTQASQTKAGTFKGKLRYMSPEQARGEAVDRRSDVFAAGILLYELTTGRRPFDGKSEFEIMEAVVYRQPQEPASLVPNFPPGLDAIIATALAKDAAQRYASALDLQMALERFLVAQQALSNAPLIGQYMRALYELDAGDAPQNQEFTRSGDLRVSSDLLNKQFGAGTPSESLESLNPAIQNDAALPPGSAVFISSSGDALEPDHVQREVDQTRPAAAVLDEIAASLQPPLSHTAEREIRKTFRQSGERPAWLWPVIAVASIALVIAALTLSWGGSGQPQTPASVDANHVGAAVVDASPSADLRRVEDTGSGTAEDSGRRLNDGARTETVLDATQAAVDSASWDLPPILRDASVAKDARQEPRARIRNKRAKKEFRKPMRPGYLTIHTEPWSEVWFKGRKLGLTPLAHVKLPAGRHRLQLVNPKLGLKKKVSVTIRSGKTTLRRIRLR